MEITTPISAEIARINGVALNAADDPLSAEVLRQRACSELLRQAAIHEGLLDASDRSCVDGVLSEQASDAIELLLEKMLLIPEPSEEACRCHHSAHLTAYSTGERVNVRHILFAVTQGIDVIALRQRAEAALLEVRCHDGKNSETVFTKTASTLSNCPSGAAGGSLGWLVATDCAPEFAKEIFGKSEVGVLPRLVHSRFGLHVVEVLKREPGLAQPFEAVHGAVAMVLRQNTYVAALRQYLTLLASTASILGVDLQTSETPLVQ